MSVFATIPVRERGRRRWTCEVVAGDRREPLEAATKPALLEAAECRLRALGARLHGHQLTISGAVAVYIGAKLRQQAWAPETLERTRDDLLQFIAALPAGPATPARSLSRNLLRRYLRRLEREGVALGSQRSRFACIHGFLHYLHCEEVLPENPASLIHAVQKPWTGKRAQRLMGRGKPQLHGAAAARAYLEAALALADPGERVAAALPLLVGLRSGEVRHLRVADVDWELTSIWVRGDHVIGASGWDVKTASSARTTPIPDELRDALRCLTEGRAALDPLLRSARSPDGCFEAAWLRRLVERVCRAADVRVVSPHGLRGTFVSICSALGRLEVPKIAALVGHSDAGTTVRRAYLGSAERQPALRLVHGGDRHAS